MAIFWTAPDPLNNDAISLYIYLKEIQNAIDTQRSVISQDAVDNFLDVSAGQKAIKSMIDQLKILTQQLALDYGYVGGITHVDLLGRDWSVYGKKYGKDLLSYPIINDLRRVLEALVLVTDLKLYVIRWAQTPETVEQQLTNPLVTSQFFVSNFNIVANPFNTDALQQKVTVGETVTNPRITDKSIITSNSVTGNPFSSPGSFIGGESTTLKFGGSRTFDDKFFYRKSGSSTFDKIFIEKIPRDMSSDWADAGIIINTRIKNGSGGSDGDRAIFDDTDSLHVSSSSIILVGRVTQETGNPMNLPLGFGVAYASVSKAGGTTDAIAHAIDLLEIPTFHKDKLTPQLPNVPGGIEAKLISTSGDYVLRGEKVYMITQQIAYYHDFQNTEPIPDPSDFDIAGRGIASGIVGVDSVGITVEVKSHTMDIDSAANFNPFDDNIPTYKYDKLYGLSNNFIYVRSRTNNWLKISDPPPTPAEQDANAGVKKFATTAGGGVTQDKDGNALRLDIMGLDSSERYLSNNPPTPDTIPVDILTVKRTNTTPRGLPPPGIDDVEITYTPNPNNGILIYEFRFRPVTGGPNFLVGSSVDSDQSPNGTGNMSLASTSDLQVKITIRTDQGFFDSQLVLLPKIIPEVVQNISVNTGLNFADVSWNAPIPFTAVPENITTPLPITKYLVRYRKQGNPTFTEIDNGLSTNITLSSLTPLESYDLRIVAVNSAGEGLFVTQFFTLT